MGNAVIKSSGMKEVENEIQKCEEKNKKLIGEVNSLKRKISDLKENEAVNTPNVECKEKISFLKTEMASVLTREKTLTKEISELQKKLMSVEKENENIKTQFAINDSNLKTELTKQQTKGKKLIEVLKKRISIQKKEINELKIDNVKNKEVATSQKEAHKKLSKECDDKVKELSLSSNEYKKKLDLIEKDYKKLQKEYEIISKYKNFMVHNETKSINVVPENRYSIKINHVDVHPNGNAKITYYFVDGKKDVFKFRGNGGLEFINSKNVSKRFGMGSHGAELKQHLGLLNTYTVVCSSVSGVNTWEFKSLSGVKKIVLEENSDWAGLKDVTLSRDTTSN